MNTKIRIALGALLGINLFVAFLPTSSATRLLPSTSLPRLGNQDRAKREHAKQGPEVIKRINQLEKFNKSVRSALAAFEKNEKRNGHKPKLAESFSLTIDPAAGFQSAAASKRAPTAGPYRKVSFKPQDPDYSDYGVEIIFIPTYTGPEEWQGTVIFTTFDPSGAYLDQYVADIAMTPDPTNTFGDVYEEVSYQDGEAWLQYGSPYFELGTPRENQDPEALQPLISAVRRPEFRKTGFGLEPQGGWGPRFPAYPNPKAKKALKCTAIWTGATAAGCGVTSFFTGGASFGPCALGGAVGSFTGCTLTAIFGS